MNNFLISINNFHDLNSIIFSKWELSEYIYSQSFILEYVSSTLLNISILDRNDEVISIFHTSVPNIKLYYPEPFIATPTFVHDDIWFLHIVIYQYWLWFGFIYMIIFFFLAFLITVRWCNIRNRPVRETRGVSRSKCGDLITATVPVSWAASIIIHESTDAIELADGFGTAEMAVGIRAYQWGWEYYYPKDMDLKFYNQKSLLLGKTNFNFKGSSNTPEYNKFKNNFIISDTSDVSNTTLSTLLMNDNSIQSLNLISSEFIFGSNKLIPKTATSLISSTKLLNSENFLNSQFNEEIKSFFWLNNWEENITSKPDFNKYNLDYLPSVNSFFSNSVLSNYSNINYFLNSKKSSTYVQNTFYFNNLNININNLFSNFNTKNFFILNSNVPVLIINDKNYNSHNPIFLTKYFNAINSIKLLNNSEIIFFNLFSDQDFKRWSSHEMIEDLKWTYNINSWNINANQLYNIFINIENLLVCNNLSFSENQFNFNFNFKNVILSDWLTRSIYNMFFIIKLNYLNNNSLNFILSNNLINLSQLDIFCIFSNNLNNSFFKKIININYFLNSSVKNNFQLNIISENSFNIDNKDLTILFKNFLIYYQAFWKVFKSTLEEERSTFNYLNYSSTDFKLPLVMTKPSPLLSSFQKSKSDFQFYNITFFIKKFNNIKFNNIIQLDNLVRYNTFNFPFMLSFESDIIRYSWLDWYSIQSQVVAKAADTSIFNLNAAKQYEFSFTKDPKIDLINKADNYFTNYAFARKFYLPDYSHNPFFFNKFRNLNSITICQNNKNNSLNLFNLILNLILLEDKFPNSSIYNYTNQFYLNYSTQLFNNHNFFPTYKNLYNEYNLFDLFISINSKRLYLLKNYIKNSNIIQPSNFTNDIWLDLKSFTKSNYSNSPINFLKCIDYKNTYINPSFENKTLKSQYIPLKKGIVNMIRIQADKAIAMPTDTRLQILAVSKDIIHSWSIPSAGIKIDCIPGYSSHRIAMFTVSGIYWGQCMEICGRFHHWMPIVVYFIRRDLFCLWCSHFIFNTKQLNSLYQGYDMRLKDSNFTISTDSSNWLYKI